jgi:AraC-like DNA-binding protein
VRRILDRIEQSYAEPITLHSLAAELHRQGAYLGGMFRRMVGMSVHQWLTTVRLDRASTLIRDGVKVEAVSLLVGYRQQEEFLSTVQAAIRHARQLSIDNSARAGELVTARSYNRRMRMTMEPRRWYSWDDTAQERRPNRRRA